MAELKIFAGNASRALAAAIAKTVGSRLGDVHVGRFADGETEVKIRENVRGTDCFVIQSTCPPVNEHVMELLILIDALSRASAYRITAVIPYYGYGRQDRKAEPRVPITAKLVANLLTAAGADRILSMDLHAGQIQGFFDIPVDHLYATPVFLEYFKQKRLEDVVVVAPDAGGVERARAFAKRMGSDLAITDKRRPRPNEAVVMRIIGDVKGKTAVILDDLIDTGGTLVKVAAALKKKGAIRILAACSHGVLSSDAGSRIHASGLEEMIITDSIPLTGVGGGQKKNLSKVRVLSIAKLLGEAILRIHREQSVSELFV
ncbi:MAG: ribose-phosphate pyrophosphokinase [Elusimicrobia bacterium]|nr:ribose-phosphate pyrophosphokinase [Elusimicrobiota bacterium]